jgi:hypothetical protein
MSKLATAASQTQFDIMDSLDRSFRFVDGALQTDLLARVGASGARHAVGDDGTLRYASVDEELVGNELICAVRTGVFPEWGVFTLEGDETTRPRITARYRAYMVEHRIPFVEEVVDGFVWFLLPDGYDSFEWGIADGEEDELDVAPD